MLASWTIATLFIHVDGREIRRGFCAGLDLRSMRSRGAHLGSRHHEHFHFFYKRGGRCIIHRPSYWFAGP